MKVPHPCVSKPPMPVPSATTPCIALDSFAASICGMFDHLEGGQFWIKDRAGRYHWVNRAFLLNYSLEQRDQVLGRTDHDLSPAPLADQYVQDDEHVLAGGSVRDRIELVGRFDHTATWSQTTKLPVRDGSGIIVGTMGITRTVDASAAQSDLPEAVVGRVLAYIRQHYAERLLNEDLARLAGRSVRAFERLFAHHAHLTPQRYVRRLRVRMACHALVEGRAPLAEIAQAHGFCDQSHFTREFRQETGLTPGDYRARYSQ